MKRLILCLLCLLMVLSLCACSDSNANTTYTVEKYGKTFEVNTQEGTIFDGKNTYAFTFSGDSSSYRINITYPNGATYFYGFNGNFGSGGWSDNYDEDLYVGGDTLCDVIAEKAPSPSNPTKVLAIFLLIGIGAFNVASPSTAWYLEYGWRYKNAEPSDMALGLNRFAGIIAIIAGIIMIFV